MASISSKQSRERSGPDEVVERLSKRRTVDSTSSSGEAGSLQSKKSRAQSGSNEATKRYSNGGQPILHAQLEETESLQTARVSTITTLALEQSFLGMKIQTWKRYSEFARIPGQCLHCGSVFISEKSTIRHAYDFHLQKEDLHTGLSKKQAVLQKGLVKLDFPNPFYNVVAQSAGDEPLTRALPKNSSKVQQSGGLSREQDHSKLQAEECRITHIEKLSQMMSQIRSDFKPIGEASIKDLTVDDQDNLPTVRLSADELDPESLSDTRACGHGTVDENAIDYLTVDDQEILPADRRDTGELHKADDALNDETCDVSSSNETSATSSYNHVANSSLAPYRKYFQDPALITLYAYLLLLDEDFLSLRRTAGLPGRIQ